MYSVTNKMARIATTISTTAENLSSSTALDTLDSVGNLQWGLEIG